MPNLRVNSKTKINEFKKKHNWLVENATIKLNVSNVKTLTNADIESLNCGDVVVKEDASGKHPYLVSFKSATGICLTYVDASLVETQSYDKVNNNWVYNSEDKTEFSSLGGTKLYRHELIFNDAESSKIYCVLNDNTPIITITETIIDKIFKSFGGQINVYGYNWGSLLTMFFDGSTLIIQGMADEGIGLELVEQDYTDITDTVTEL